VSGAAWILRGGEVRPRDLPLVGGKGVNLARIARAGRRVPPWFAISTEAFHRVLAASGTGDRIRARTAAFGQDDDAAIAGAAREIRAWILELPIPGELRAAVETACAEVLGEGHVAVRSSATEEDTAEASFAGLHDSVLFVRGLDEVLAAVRRVWASAYNDRALAYRRARGYALEDIAVGVIVQRMIEGTTSGVMFTVNPTSADAQEIVVNATFGAGEGLVSGAVDADTFVWDKQTRGIRKDIAVKEEQLVLNTARGRGVIRVPVPEERRRLPSLTDDQVAAVARAGLAIEASFGWPQDVEFCFDRGGSLFILQSRPITTVEEPGPAAGNRLVWDNSNIIESYSGVTSPMTFSFIRHAYTIVYHCFAEVMGIHPRVVRENQRTFENMLGLIRGQVFYNLRNWHRLIQLFPGYRYNRAFMESMMGVRESFDADDGGNAELGWRERYLHELPALVRMALRSTWNFLFIRRIVADFERLFRTHYERWSALDLSSLPPHDLYAIYWDMEDRLLWKWRAPIINDFFVMIFYGTLKKLCGSWCGDATGSLQNDLICGEGGVESTEPTRMLLELAARARADSALRELILRRDAEDVVHVVEEDERFGDFAAGIRRYLELYGFRCVDELKLEAFSLKERPAFLYRILRNYLDLEDAATPDVAGGRERERGIRREAEVRAREALAGGPWGPLRWRIFSWVLGRARLGVKNRENMRFARTRIYGLLRQVLRAIGVRFADEGILDARDDIFHLTMDEVRDFIHGTAVTTDLRGLVALRRREFDAFREDAGAEPDDRFETYGMAYHRNRFRGRQPRPAPPEDGVLRGIACCPGQVTAAVKVLSSPTEDASLRGEILVAGRTDPGWVPLYPSVSGLLVERGSILSHSAIVAREMGIPTIVGIPGLLATLETGTRVAMDGAAGTVRILDGLTPGSTAE
jgi:pyruvate,water dikinase